MKACGWFFVLVACLGGGCQKAPEAKTEARPVVYMAPVETRPYEDGYDAGYELGLGQGKPGAKMPAAAEVEPLASVQAGLAPERTERWQRGFVEGYLDGFRKVVTGQK